ncbi:RNA polymerase factor sigma-54 [Bacillus sp. 1NLA3E]|uniref:RNA polymerase factor sigma-54 n=1 Tax=Bacillus sp. 1NLA3E TaxID=666686 RepID=UPI000247E2AC|nr:RNA polymerase factor sigma-54 [Bacillus sp. 1NLA3E]AGK55998.1 RNA polymerase factor sigma-54 [Bacillus sp. 1NLA3E]
MNLGAGLWQQQTLKLAMTQELSQAIALLQYSAQELTSFLESKSLENPLLTIKDAPIDKDYKQLKAERNKSTWIEQIVDKSFSLEEQLLSQLNLNKYTRIQLTIIKTLLLNLDENGYFRGDIGEISLEMNAPRQLVEESLGVIQGLEPAGIAARNLQECLLIQIQRKRPEDKLAIKIIAEYFVLFAEKKWINLSKEMKVTIKEIQNVFDRIQKLNPKPGLEFSTDQTHYIIPDAIIEVTKNGISVRLWEVAVPKIKFNTTYYQKFSECGDHLVNRFLQEKLQDFNGIMKGIEQRRETLAKVIVKISEKQREFFLEGPNHLNPMTMKELAQELEVHESTISRAVREKYVQTPSGMVMLKSFFSSAVPTVSDKKTSSIQVKNTLSVIIANENKHNPLSDQEIVEILKEKESIVISRRTIAKYRDQLGIPSWTSRKRY